MGAIALPLAFVLGVLVRFAANGALAGAAFITVGGVGLLVFGLGIIRVNMWRCPRCNRLFFSKGLTLNPLARRCRHCGLAKWANPYG